MREIRIENVKPEILTHLVVALKEKNVFLLREKVLNEIKRQTKQVDVGKMAFTTDYGEVSVETVVELAKYSQNHYRICSITVNGQKVYGSSPWVDTINEIILIDAE